MHCINIMSTLDVHIFGVREREHMLEATAVKLGIDKAHIHYDDRPDGGCVMYTAKKAWLADIPNEITHRVVLQDDVEACNGAIEIWQEIVNTHPDAIFSLCPFQYPRKQVELDNLLTPYLEANTMSACGIIMPVKYIKPCFDWIDKHHPDAKEDDFYIERWAEVHSVRRLTTIPATVQHIGDKSVYTPTAPIRRTAYYEENPKVDWDNHMIGILPHREWFFSNHGKQYTTGGEVKYVS